MNNRSSLVNEIVNYWRNVGDAMWFAKDNDLDYDVRRRFKKAYLMASQGGCNKWQDSADGALALIILTDQFPRNIFRGSSLAYATDSLAKATARKALKRGWHTEIDLSLRIFFYLPFQHSEVLADQDISVALFENHALETGDHVSLQFAILHRDIIRRFLRFPHRNSNLGRISTGDELMFLEKGGFPG